MNGDDVLGRLRLMPDPVMEAPPSDWEDGPALRRAAVLVPLVLHPEGLTVVFCQRSKLLRRHAGEVSFPGGRIEEGEDEVTAALREAREEIGLDPASVTILGRLDTHRAGSGYSIAPVVGVLAPPVVFHPDRVEIDEAFEVPLGFLLEPGNHRQETMFWRGADRAYNVWEFGDRYIWGATATVLLNLLRVLRAER